jgi:Phage tail lysozyme
MPSPTTPLENFNPQNTPTDSSNLSSGMWDQMPRPTTGAATEATQLNFAVNDIYKAATIADASPPPSPAAIAPVLKKASSIDFTTPAQDGKNGTQPDYFMSDDGQLHKNANGKPDPGGKITIELQTKNKNEVDAKNVAAQLQKATVKDLINYFKKSHPAGTPIPQDWMDQLSKEPGLPPAPAPLAPLDSAPSTTDPPQSHDTPQPATTGNASGAEVNSGGGSGKSMDGGGSGGGGGGGGSGGGDGGGGGGDGGGGGGGGSNAGEGGMGSGGGGGIPATEAAAYSSAITPGSSAGSPFGPGEQVDPKQLYDYFMEKGFSAEQAAGILGNMKTESGFSTGAYNGNEGALGLCQWEGGRLTNLQALAQQEGKPVTDWHVQADFVMQEFNGDHHAAMAGLQESHTPQEAAQVFQSQFENSASLGDRPSNAVGIYNQLGHGSASKTTMV